MDKNTNSVSIFGSCVSREIFNQPQLSDILIENYFQKNSIITLFEEKFSIDIEKVKAPSKFLQRMTYFDFNKKVLDSLSEKISDWLIIDFCELRFDIIRIEYNGIKTSLTNCECTRNTINDLKSQMGDALNIVYGESPYWYDSKLFGQYMDKFIKFILNLYPPEKIIIINAKNCYKYIDDDGLFSDYGDLMRLIKENLIFDRATKYFYEKLDKKPILISLPEDINGDKNHRLGFSALHFEKSCYEYLANCVYACIKNNAKQQEIDDLYNAYFDKIKKEKRVISIKTSVVRRN